MFYLLYAGIYVALYASSCSHPPSLSPLRVVSQGAEE